MNSILSVRNILSLILVTLFASSTIAQTIPVVNQWQETKGLYNSASVGTREDLYITTLYSMQWIGIEGAPINMMFFADLPIKLLNRQHGLGIAIDGQKKGLFINTQFQGQYAFQLKLFKGILALGLEAGLFNSSFDGSKVFIPDGEGLTPSDPSLPQQQISGRAFDTGAGIFYTHKNLYMGIGVTHLLQSKVPLGTNYEISLRRTYTAMAGYNIIQSNTLLSWHPSILTITDLQAWCIELALCLTYNKKYFAQLIYKWRTEAGFSIGAKFGKVRLGYAFSMPTSELARGNYGTHELVVSYSIPRPKKKDLGMKKKSIRLL